MLQATQTAAAAATRWILPPVDTGLVAHLAHELNVSEATATVLVRRGVHSFDDARRFFRPDWSHLADPAQMKGMGEAVQRIRQAVANGEPVLIYGDYDVDGTTSVALVGSYFRHHGWAHGTYVPDRATEGYGLSQQGIEYAAANGYGLVLAFDCGIREVARTEHAAALGIDLVICDHHQPGPTLPAAVAILNPKQPGCAYPEKELSGCGIAFTLLRALDATLGLHTDLGQWLDLVALSTACDLVPMLGENRILSALGQDKLRRDPLPGIRALMDLAQDRPRRWDTADLVFFLGPRINAAGRIQHARAAVELLQGHGDAAALAASTLESNNAERKGIEQAMVQAACAMCDADPGFAERAGIVLYDEGWHKGVVGIVAAKLVDRYYRPTVLLTQTAGDDGTRHWVGSARSVDGFDIHAALDACAPHLLRYGGHRFAAGLAVAADTLADFVAAFYDFCNRHVPAARKARPQYVDAELPLAALNAKFVRVQQQMAPFGPGNLHPYYLARGLQVRRCQVLKEKHLRLELQQGPHVFDAVGFHLAERCAEWLPQAGSIAAVFYPEFNNWNGRESIRLVLKDLQPEPVDVWPD